MDSIIHDIQEKFEACGRAILRYIDANKDVLKPKENVKLAKFVFGCMNQKFTIASRVEKRGSVELEKALRYIGKASEAMFKIDERLKKQEGQ